MKKTSLLKCALVLIISACIVTAASDAKASRAMPVDGSSGLGGVRVATRQAVNLGRQTVIDSIPAPGSSHMGLAFDGQFIWSTSNAFTPIVVYKIDPATGTVVTTLTTGINTYVLGTTYLNGSLWIQEWWSYGYTYEIDPNTGSILSYFVSPAGTNSRGLTDDGTYLWIMDAPSAIAYQVTTTGTIVRSVNMYGVVEWAMDAAWDYQRGTLFLCDDAYANNIKELDVSGATAILLQQFPHPGAAYTPEGICYDGQYLWTTAFDALWIWKIDIGDPGPVTVWDFETGWQGWTHTNGLPFPGGWEPYEADWRAPTYQCPSSGDSSMCIDADEYLTGTADTALSPILAPHTSMDWLRYGFLFNNITTSGGDILQVGIKYYNGSVWTAVPLKTYDADYFGNWDSVDVTTYATYPLIQIYFYYYAPTWDWYAAFDNVSIAASIAQHDVGATAILEPSGVYFLNDLVTPQTVLKNFGDYDETFDAILTMTHNASVVYADTVSVELDVAETDTAVFASYTFTDAGVYDVLSYTVLVGDENPDNDTATALANVYTGLIPYVIIDPDPTPLTGPYLNSKFQSWGVSGVYTTNGNVINADSLALYQTVWICDGMYPNYYAITNDQATGLGTYLATGGAAYCEGGDCWGWVTSNVILDPLFGIDPYTTYDGTSDLYTVQGQANGQIPQVAGHNWSYTGENNYVDQLGLYASPPNGGTVEGFLWNPAVYYWTGAAYNQGTWKTVGLSHELAGDVPGTIPTDSLLMWIAQYLGLPVGIAEQPFNNNVHAFGFAPRMSTLARDQVSINYTTTVQGHVSLHVYDGVGRLVQTLVNAELPAGEKSLVWNRRDMNGRKVANGVYFFKLQAENNTATHKLVLVD